MTEHERIEAEICQVLARERQAIPLSNTLFDQAHGLFGKLANTEAERRAVTRSPLFSQALCRLAELRAKEVAEFRNAAEHLENLLPGSKFQLRMEKPPRRSTAG